MDPFQAPAAYAPACEKCNTLNRAGGRFCEVCGCDLTVKPAAGTLSCPACGQENPADCLFCTRCRAALTPSAEAPRACPGCGVRNPPASAFCLECGKPLEGDPPESPPPAKKWPEAMPAWYLIVMLLMFFAFPPAAIWMFIHSIVKAKRGQA